LKFGYNKLIILSFEDIKPIQLSAFIYHLGNFFYTTAIQLASLWNAKAKKWVSGRKQDKDKFEALAKNSSSNNTIWMHCASLGEFEQGRPLLENIKAQQPNTKIVISFFSPSGYEVQKNYAGADFMLYLPINSKQHAIDFIEAVKPNLVIWVKYDYWSHYLLQLKEKNIPTLLISAKFRNGQPFFKWYGGYWKRLLNCFTQIFVQDEASIKLLQHINIEHTTLVGDTRFDRVLAIAAQHNEISIAQSFCGNYNTIVAGSTWEEDEEELCHFANNNLHLKFIIAPHQIEEDRLKDIEKLFKHSIRYSQYQTNHTANVLIIDNIGMLSTLYKYGTICYVGGGFGGDGVHNILEAAVYGKPILFGPEYEKYKEAIDLVELEGAFEIENAIELEEIINELLTDSEFYKNTCTISKKYVNNHAGSSQKIMDYVTANRLLTKS
jgi:3-deoxy-D-manno-octulosonic-acid transferase